MPQSARTLKERRARVYGKFTISYGGLYLGSAPEQCLEIPVDDAADRRRLLCRRYVNCLTHAAALGWTGWECSGCVIEDPLSVDEQRRDLDGLTDFLHALNLSSVRKLA